jgi:glucose-1-phosphate adenylyltransferase
MLSSNREALYAYRFDGYWRNVDTLENLWESNMDLLSSPPGFLVNDEGREVYTSASLGGNLPYRFQRPASRDLSLLSGSNVILGKVEHSVLSDSVFVGEGAEVVDSILMPNVYVGSNAKIYKAIVAPRSHIMDGAGIGVEDGGVGFVSNKFCTNGVSLVAPWVRVNEDAKFQQNSYIA